jgi:hypothetical protein
VSRNFETSMGTALASAFAAAGDASPSWSARAVEFPAIVAAVISGQTTPNHVGRRLRRTMASLLPGIRFPCRHCTVSRPRQPAGSANDTEPSVHTSTSFPRHHQIQWRTRGLAQSRCAANCHSAPPRTGQLTIHREVLAASIRRTFARVSRGFRHARPQRLRCTCAPRTTLVPQPVTKTQSCFERTLRFSRPTEPTSHDRNMDAIARNAPQNAGF